MQKIRILAALTATVVWVSLAVQLVLLARMFGPAEGTWRFLGFFTSLSNFGIAAIATTVAIGGVTGMIGPRARFMALTAILAVGLVYSVLLRSLWNPTGLQRLAGIGLHDAAPVLFATLWAMMPHGELRWRDLRWALAPPALYLAYACLRGSIDGWYPYTFLDPRLQGPGGVLAGIAAVLAIFAIVGAAVIAVDARLPNRRQPRSSPLAIDHCEAR